MERIDLANDATPLQTTRLEAAQPHAVPHRAAGDDEASPAGARLDVPADDRRIAREVEALRARHPGTRELYRAVCACLFFEHGIVPTTTRLYQLVRKGSMAVPGEELARFWETIRARERPRIDEPSLPPEIAAAAGALASTLWARAQDAARAGFADREARIRAVESSAEARCAQALDDARRARDEAERAEAQAAERLRERDAAQAEAQALRDEIAMVRARLDETRDQLAESHATLERVRAEAVAEAAQARAAVEAAQARVDEVRRDAAREIESAARVRLQVEAALERMRVERAVTEAELQARLGAARREAAIAAERQEAATRRADLAESALAARRDELAALREAGARRDADLERATAATALAEREVERLRGRLDGLRPTPPLRRGRRVGGL